MPTTLDVVQGTRPGGKIVSSKPDCPDQRWECGWGVLSDGRWWLKFVNNGCQKHSPRYKN